MDVARNTTEPFWDLVEESLEEAAFLWKRWEADLTHPTRSLDEVWSWTEDRLQGALDGVRVAGSSVTRMAASALGSEDPAQITVGAHLLADRSTTEGRLPLAAAIQAARGLRLSSMIRGMELAELDRSFVPVAAALAASGPEHCAALCRLKAFRRATLGRELNQAFECDVPAVQAEALRSLHHLTDDSTGRFVQAAVSSPHPSVRRAAIESGVRRGMPAAWHEARRLVRERDPDAGPFLSLVALLGSEQDRAIVASALEEPALRQHGVFAVGYLGTPEAVGICIDWMRDRELARSAGEAYCTITGANLQRDHLAAPQVDDAETLPDLAADDLEADLIPEAYDSWPVPDVASVGRHWSQVKSAYARGVRHLYGRPVDLRGLMRAIEAGSMLRRPDLITEVAVRTHGRYDVESRTFTHLQRRMMLACASPQ
jgi:uncharacterized protein (TIGR02270 family)